VLSGPRSPHAARSSGTSRHRPRLGQRSETIDVHLRVDLGGLDPLMPEHLTDVAEGRAVSKHVRRQRMA
jgi:hypothetical protein